MDPCEKLWGAVLERAFHDANGEITALSGTTSDTAKKLMQLEAKRFLLENKWIFYITGIDQQYLLERLK